MPLPVTKNKGAIMDVIKSHHPSWPRKKKVAVMLNQARKAGANIPLKNELKRRAKKA